jgi:hypothetical protein
LAPTSPKFLKAGVGPTSIWHLHISSRKHFEIPFVHGVQGIFPVHQLSHFQLKSLKFIHCPTSQGCWSTFSSASGLSHFARKLPSFKVHSLSVHIFLKLPNF